MQTLQRVLGASFAVVLCAQTGWAQQSHVIGQRALDQAVQQRVSQEQADRDAIRTFLRNPAVSDVATRAGLPIDKAQAAVSTLQGDQLRQAADQARLVNDQLAGGAETITLTATTIIIILLVLVLLIVALK